MARILIIDDEAALRRTMRRMLAGTGHEIVEASNGAEGLAVLQERAVDLVITDLVMPDKDGIETIQILRERWPELKILAVSGRGLLNPRERLADAQLFGADAALPKPFKVAELLEQVAALLLPES